jgi:glycosyltransferase involved in cell wall biosynthesis
MSESKALCSVVIPVFRGERYLGEALDSVRRQTHPSWEVLVVEDGSHDRAEEIVREFGCRVPGHRVVFQRHEANSGVSAARNSAIRLARGDVVALLDHDDAWCPEHLSQSLAALFEQNADLVFCDVNVLDCERGVMEETQASVFDADWRRRLFYGNFIVNSSVVLRRPALDKAGVFDTDPSIQFCEDYDLWLRLASHGMRFFKVGRRNVIYRRHPTQATARIGMIREREWHVVRKHLRGYPVSKRDRCMRAAQINLRNGMFFWSSDPPLARRYLWRSASYSPWSAQSWWLALKRTVVPCGWKTGIEGIAAPERRHSRRFHHNP